MRIYKRLGENPSAERHRIFWLHVRLARHANLRYAQLLPRLSDSIKSLNIHIELPDNRFINSIVRHLKSWLLYPCIYPYWLNRLNNCYDTMFCTDLSLIPLFPGKIIVDIDDPALDEEEIAILNSPNVAVVVTTTALLKKRLQDLGLDKPCEVIASGVDLDWIERARSRYEVECAPNNPDETDIRLCFVAPKLLTKEEAVPGSETYSLRTVDFLLSAMREVWKTHSEVELWLIGNPSPGVRRLSNQHPQIKLWGYVNHNMLAEIYVRAHIGLYPRLIDLEGRHSIKIIEYMAAGMPIVSTDVGEAFHIKRSQAGLLAATSKDFATAIVNLVEDPRLRHTLAERGKAYSKQFDWQQLANRYKLEVLDIYAG